MTPHFRDHRQHAEAIINAVLRAADPGEAVRRRWQPLAHLPTLLVAIGKASRAMAAAALELIDVPELCGIVTAPPQYAAPLDPRVSVFPCDHPLPTARNVIAATAIRDSILRMHERHGSAWQLLLLISGGGSAHLTLPAGSLTLDDLRRVNSDVQLAGADIVEVNTVRKHTELLKGGRLAALVFPATVSSLVLSDVIGDRLDVIASGPVSPDPTTYADALVVLDRRIPGSTHQPIALHLQEGSLGKHPETPKPGDRSFTHARAEVIANNDFAISAAEHAMTGFGFRVERAITGVTGDAAERARQFAEPIDAPFPACRLLGGETTVNVGAARGKGGPSQEFALAAAIEIGRRSSHRRDRAALLAFSTDGADGPTDAAGALVTHETYSELVKAGIDPAAALANHDSYRALDRTGALIRTGSTGTNVNHIAVLMAYPPEV